MDFYSVINSRRTIRDFDERTVDMDILKRVLSAGLKAPTNDHMRSWEFVLLTDRAKIAELLANIPNVSLTQMDNIMKSSGQRDAIQVEMYHEAVPKQYEMLSKSGCLLLPFFKQPAPLLSPRTLSSLNPFASIWCCIENILLAAAAEGLGTALRIPFPDESGHITKILGHPEDYVLPCYIALGWPAADAVVVKQKECNLEERLHINRW